MKECLDEYRVRSDPAFARKQVFKRDKGICAGCGQDSKRAHNILYRLYTRWIVRGKNPKFFGNYTLLTRSKKYRWFSPNRYHAWEMDHIIPVAEGGGGCPLEGLRTLCIPCHLQASKELAARLAAGRRAPRIE